jgi:arylsulfatase
MSQDYAAFAGRTMVVHADGKAIDYVGIDAKPVAISRSIPPP